MDREYSEAYKLGIERVKSHQMHPGKIIEKCRLIAILENESQAAEN